MGSLLYRHKSSASSLSFPASFQSRRHYFNLTMVGIDRPQAIITRADPSCPLQPHIGPLWRKSGPGRIKQRAARDSLGWANIIYLSPITRNIWRWQIYNGRTGRSLTFLRCIPPERLCERVYITRVCNRKYLICC